ncbi:MAG TPA: fumarylacetoacetate hydrolase family protein [Caulobacteraceae bacterium]|nr:fumarylacetoacetate hydrolase family protein [Caulobacteraceae bacterium]
MKFITFERDGAALPGLWLGEGRIADLGDAFGSVLDVIDAGEEGRKAARRLATDEAINLSAAGVRLLAPIPRTRKNVFCVGRNYAEHVKEGARFAGASEVKLPEVPQFFTKAPTAINAPGDPVRLDEGVTRFLDYEVELAVVIGKAGRDIPRERAYEHVFGYTIANDITARDLQRRHDQWFKGKSLDNSLPLGPWIVDADEIGDPTTLELSLTVNGEERQRATTSMMIFDIPAIIASLSAGMTLEAGDVIATGTPSGVGYAMTPPQGLKDGDVVVARIDRIGELVTPIKAV